MTRCAHSTRAAFNSDCMGKNLMCAVFALVVYIFVWWVWQNCTFPRNVGHNDPGGYMKGRRLIADERVKDDSVPPLWWGPSGLDLFRCFPVFPFWKDDV